MQLRNDGYELVPVTALKRHPKNPRKGDQVAIAESIAHNGFYGALIVQKRTGYILAGNHRFDEAKKQDAKEIPVIWLDVDDDEAERILLVDNRSNDLASYDDEALKQTLSELLERSGTLDGTGYDESFLEGLIGGDEKTANPTLSERFLVPPFSVLDARQGYWQDRKREWLAMGIESELGRGGASPGGSPPPPPTVTQNPDGTLNYKGTAGQSNRFDKQRRGGVARRKPTARV